MTREEFAEKWGWKYEGVDLSTELLADLDSVIKSSLPPAEGAEANRASIDDLIKKHIPIDAANFEYCAKHNIINGGLLQGIRDVVNSFMKPQPTAEGAEEILKRHCKENKIILTSNDFHTWLNAINEIATLHAQRIADKMVSEMYSPEKREVFIQAVFNEKVDEAIKERMPTEEECEKVINTVSQGYCDKIRAKSFALGFKGCYEWFRSRMEEKK